MYVNGSWRESKQLSRFFTAEFTTQQGPGFAQAAENIVIKSGSCLASLSTKAGFKRPSSSCSITEMFDDGISLIWFCVALSLGGMYHNILWFKDIGSSCFIPERVDYCSTALMAYSRSIILFTIDSLEHRPSQIGKIISDYCSEYTIFKGKREKGSENQTRRARDWFRHAACQGWMYGTFVFREMIWSCMF